MKILAQTFLTASLLLLFQQCDYVKILHEENDIIVKDEWLDDFNEIVVEIPIELELEQTNEAVAIITGPDYKVDNLLLTIDNNVLTIDVKSFVYERKDQVLKIKLPIKNLRKITLNMPTILRSIDMLTLDKFSLAVNGPGTYSESDLHLKCNSIYVGAYGKNSGHHILKGTTGELTLRLEGLAWSDAKQLLASKVKVVQRSLKSSYVHASDKLAVEMYSEGNVYYSGDPELDYRIIQPDWNPEFGQVIQQGD